MKNINVEVVKDFHNLKLKGYLCAPKSIQIETNTTCPLSCPQCYKPSINKGSQIKWSQFCNHVDEAAGIGVKSIVLIGGEPMIHIDIMRMIEYVVDLGLNAAIYTSGWGVSEATVNRFKAYSNRLYLFLSLNGSTKEINEKSRDGYETTINAMRILKEKGCLYGINWVARHDNLMDFPSMVELSKRMGAEYINIVCNKINGSGLVDSPLTHDDYTFLVEYITKYRDRNYINRSFDRNQ